MQDRLIFLIGAPRSGSTLTARMLGSHSQIHAPAEPHLMPPLAHLGYGERVEEAPYDPIITQIGLREFVAQLPGGEEDWFDAQRAMTNRLYARSLAPSGRRMFLDKTPAYALVLGYLTRLYPKAHYVVLTRNPMAVWSSFVDSFFDGDHRAAYQRNPVIERYVPAIARFLQERPVPMIHLRYEDLVQAPDEQMQKVCEFLGLSFEPGMVDYGAHEGGGGPATRGLGDPVTVARETRPTTRSIDKWATALGADPERLSQCREIAARLTDPDLEIWGYPTLRKDLAAIEPTSARPPRKKLTRYALERRVLVGLRRNIQTNALGRLVRRVRNVCDLLLR